MGNFRVLEEDGEATYHAWTRCVDGRFFFKEVQIKGRLIIGGIGFNPFFIGIAVVLGLANKTEL